MTAAPNRWTPDAYTLLREMHGPASVERVARARGEIVYHCLECRTLHRVVSSEGAQGGRSDGYCASCFAGMEARWRARWLIEDAQLEEGTGWMGTNYYWIPNPCPTCGHGERVHIGKSSAGWVFSLHVHPGDDIHGLRGWVNAWRIGTIVDEYDETVSADEMLRTITERARHGGPDQPAEWYAQNSAEPGPNRLARHKIDGRHCIGHGEGTWDLCVGEFS